MAVLKSDFTKIAADLTTMQTYMATASSNAGKFKALHLAEVTATPATSIPLHHLSVNGYAATGTPGAWKQLILAEVSTTPATNIQLFHLNTGGYAASGTTGAWKQLILDGSVTPGTNISIIHLKRTGTVSTISGSFLFPNGHNSTSSGSNRVQFVTPSSIEGDGGASVKYYFMGQATSVSGYALPASLYSSVIMGSLITDGSGTYHCPHFLFWGVNGSGSAIALSSTAKIYGISES